MPRTTCEWPRPSKPTHRCGRCGKTKPFTREFWGPDKRSRWGLTQGWCKKCINAYAKQRNLEDRTNVLVHYGGGNTECACCGDCRFEFMTLDHIHGGGNAHRLAVTGSKKGGSKLYRWLIDNKFPPGFQVLCYNCNMGRAAHGGRCPYASIHARQNKTRLERIA